MHCEYCFWPLAVRTLLLIAITISRKFPMQMKFFLLCATLVASHCLLFSNFHRPCKNWNFRNGNTSPYQ